MLDERRAGFLYGAAAGRAAVKAKSALPEAAARAGGAAATGRTTNGTPHFGHFTDLPNA
jgi:hypothetical protein